MLYALRPDSGYFTLSAPGNIEVDVKGVTSFSASPSGRHRYLIVNDAQRAPHPGEHDLAVVGAGPLRPAC